MTQRNEPKIQAFSGQKETWMKPIPSLTTGRWTARVIWSWLTLALPRSWMRNVGEPLPWLAGHPKSLAIGFSFPTPRRGYLGGLAVEVQLTTWPLKSCGVKDMVSKLMCHSSAWEFWEAFISLRTSSDSTGQKRTILSGGGLGTWHPPLRVFLSDLIFRQWRTSVRVLAHQAIFCDPLSLQVALRAASVWRARWNWQGGVIDAGEQWKNMTKNISCTGQVCRAVLQGNLRIPRSLEECSQKIIVLLAFFTDLCRITTFRKNAWTPQQRCFSQQGHIELSSNSMALWIHGLPAFVFSRNLVAWCFQVKGHMAVGQKNKTP